MGSGTEESRCEQTPKDQGTLVPEGGPQSETVAILGPRLPALQERARLLLNHVAQGEIKCFQRA